MQWKDFTMPINVNVKTKIIINGKEYASPEEMPPDIRSKYEAALAKRSAATSSSGTMASKITLNGKSYNSVDEMPANVRQIYDGVLATVDKNQDGIPDLLQENSQDTLQPSAPFLPKQANVISSSKTDRRMVVAAGMVILVLLILGVLALVLLSR
jgi:hypothetical protein